MANCCRHLFCGLFLLGFLSGAHHAAAVGKPALRRYCQAPADTLPGQVRRYYENGRLLESYTRVNGVLEGPWVIYFPSGRVDREMTFLAGRPHGLYKSYDKQGRLEREIGYVNGVLDGPWVFYYQGAKSIQATFQNGKLEGRYAVFYPTGALKVQAQYHQGNLASKVSAYTKEGQLVNEEVPNAAGDRVMTRLTYDKAGRLKRSEAVDFVPSGTYLGPAIMGGSLGGKQ
ncbi:toxin-antitoxin system YwqK family antitoxin [Hymenobacter chitinivorans]|uniref:Antitoxin component YwqK of YwqJK toxin-antitoxin module n=1 Tax=Hymenobacter chitinivorans DSM 11115 TaxID=1121954 RepID=A0A2M9BNH4_9BACT|nr:toxin-antitoxin system YwqK family antitoxin [Hymenobacter chitinivorans]PJJ59501.1 antitoxin component YwqK of YwqJK toxin-antitoxin module [Hymenobacter chitinivorans DSM 11115]